MMNRIVLGALGALLLVAAGVFWWQGHASVENAPPPPTALPAVRALPEDLPTADIDGLEGPELPHADPITREQKRFDRLDRDRDGRITRNEMLLPRVRDFRKLDVDGNNLLTFEEWAVKTVDRFKGADANGDLWLSREEFVSTRPKQRAKPACKCP